MKKIFQIVILFIIVSMLVTGCFHRAPEEQLKLFSMNTCKLPCWMGIEPSVTNLSETTQKLDEAKIMLNNVGVSFDYSFMDPDPDERIKIISRKSNIYIGFNREDVVDRISFYFDGGPKAKDFVALLGEPEQIGICLAFRRAVPILVYDGTSLHYSASVPNYNFEDETILYKEPQDQKIDLIVLEKEPRIQSYHFSLKWEDFAQDYTLDINAANLNSDCGAVDLPWRD